MALLFPTMVTLTMMAGSFWYKAGQFMAARKQRD